MNLFGFGGTGDYLSVDFGASAIKIAKATVSGNDGMQISLADSEPLPDVPPDQYIEESGRVLSELVDRNDVQDKQNVILALPANDVIVRRLELPSMPDERMSKVIGYEAESHIPFPLDQVVLDHHVVSKSEEGTEVILAAIKEENLNEHLDVIYEANLNPEVVDVTAFSYFNLFQFLETEEQEEEKPRVLVDVGHGNTDIMVFEGETLYFARSASVAGEALTEDIAKKLGVELQEAQKLKHEYGHVPLEEETEAAAEAEGEDMDALSQLAAEREESEAEEPAAESPEPESAEEEEPEEDLEVGGLELGSPQSPSEEPEEESEETEPEPPSPEAEAEAAAEPEEEAGGLSLGHPQEPAGEDTTEVEPESAPESPGESSAASDTETEESGEEEGLSLGQPKEPGSDEEAAPEPPEEATEGGQTENDSVTEEKSAPAEAGGEEEEISLGQTKAPPAGEEESEAGSTEEISENESAGEESPPEPPEESAEEAEAKEDTSLGQPKEPDTVEEKAEPEEEAADQTEDEAPEAPPSPPSTEEPESETEETEETAEADQDISLGSTREPEESGSAEEETGSGGLGDGLLDGGGEEDEEDSEEKDKLMGTGGENSDEEDEDEDGGLSLGAAANDSPEEAPEDSEKAAEVGSAIKPQIERLIGELRHTFDYFQSQLDGGEIEEIIISGGTSKLKNLPEFISDQLGYPARRLELSDKISGVDAEKLPEFVVACGLQLRAVPELARVDVNLVPGNIVEQKRAQTRKQKLTAVGIFAGVMVLMVLATAYLLYSQRKAMFNTSKEKIKELKPIVDQVDELKETKARVKKRLNVIQNLEKQKAQILPFLYDLNSFPRPQYSEALRDRTWFKSFNYSKSSSAGSFKIDGVTGDFEDASKVFKWMESRNFILNQENESMSKQEFVVGQKSQKMVTFSAQYNISFSQSSSEGD